MPRITKAMLEEELAHVRRFNERLYRENTELKSKVSFLEKYSQVQYLNSYVIAHEKEVDALTHAVTALTTFIERRDIKDANSR